MLPVLRWTPVRSLPTEELELDELLLKMVAHRALKNAACLNSSGNDAPNPGALSFQEWLLF